MNSIGAQSQAREINAARIMEWTREFAQIFTIFVGKNYIVVIFTIQKGHFITRTSSHEFRVPFKTYIFQIYFFVLFFKFCSFENFNFPQIQMTPSLLDRVRGCLSSPARCLSHLHCFGLQESGLRETVGQMLEEMQQNEWVGDSKMLTSRNLMPKASQK